MSNLVPFDFKGNDVRTMTKEDGTVWFVAKDVCHVLEITNSRDATAGLDDDEKADVGITDTSSNGTEQRRNFKIISESGMYKLAFKSRTAQAKVFTKWIAAEVLPSIRKTGQYSVQQDLSPARMVLAMAEAMVRMEEAQKKNAMQQQVIADKVHVLESKMQSPVEEFTIMGFNQLKHRKPLPINKAAAIGKAASRMSRKLGYNMGTTTDPRFGTVNTYHQDILEMIFDY